MMTDIDVSKLTDKHRLVMRDYRGDGTHETGLYSDEEGYLRTTVAGIVIRCPHGRISEYAADHIVKVIDPPFEPRPGMVLTVPGQERDGENIRVAVRLPDAVARDLPWLASPDLTLLLGDDFGWMDDEEVAGFVADGKLVEAVGQGE